MDTGDMEDWSRSGNMKEEKEKKEIENKDDDQKGNRQQRRS